MKANMFFTTALGRLRLLGYCEGITLLLLVFFAMPLKYVWLNPIAVRILGPIHGVCFLLFVFYGFSLSVAKDWSFTRITLKLFIASFIPFGNFYVDHKILKPMQEV